MPTERSISELLAACLAAIGSQTAPNSITETTLEALMEDILSSYWNKKDGITVGAGFDTPLTLPDYFNGSIVNGALLRDWIQVLMNKISATQVLVTGGIQGREGEFLAIIMEETRQTFTFNLSTPTTYTSIAKIKFVNDKDRGGFDNGNNWLVDTFITPAAGQPAIQTSGNGIILDVITNTIGPNSGASGFDFKLCIMKGAAILATSNIVSIRDGGGTPEFYIKDWATGTLAYAATDEISIQLFAQAVNVFTGSVIMQISNGFINHKRI